METLRALRHKRTRTSNAVRQSIAWMLQQPAKWDLGGRVVEPGFQGLPSWWPFWSDSLKDSVRDVVRAARELQQAEEGQ